MVVSVPAHQRKRRTQVLIADDHALVRGALTQLFSSEPDMDVVGDAVDGRDAVEQARRLRPDVVVMDVSMPRLGGVEATREVRRLCPGVRVVGLSMHESDDMARVMLEAGAAGYVSKSAPAEDLLAAVRLAGGNYSEGWGRRG